MAGGKKRKHAEISSLPLAQPEHGSGGSSHSVAKDDKMFHVINTLQLLTSQLSDLKAELKESEQDNKLKFKKLNPVLKKYVKDQALYLVNEFLSFIGQIHKTGLQRKFDKKYSTGKFQKLIDNPAFSSDCEEFLRNDSDPDGKSLSDIIDVFNSLCDKRNRVAHFEEPEDCLQDILKFQDKHSDMLYKCHKDVQFCLARIARIAKHFIGPYRLQRLTCEFLASFLASHGHSWKKISRIGELLESNEELVHMFIPKGLTFKVWKCKVMDMFTASLSYGHTFSEDSNHVDGNYSSIQEKFQKCVKLGMLPEKQWHTLEYSVLESSVDPGQD